MTLHAEIGLAVGALDLDLSLQIGPGEVVALIGPNGAGKTTAIRSLAGLQRLERGRIALDDTVWDDPSTGAFVQAERRAVGVVFQDLLLFPHLSVLDNVAFGPRARGVAKRAANTAAATWIDRVGLTDLAGARPADISGGQAQRVALARALVDDPQVLLLDEPLAALDAATRASVRRDLRGHLRDFDGATVLVTHDPLDALALADHVVVLEHGRATQRGTIAEVATRPRTPYVAELLGVNLLHGEGDGNRVTLPSGVVVATGGPVAGPSLALIRPSSIALHLTRPATSARNLWRLTIVGFDLLGDRVRVRMAGQLDLVAEITPSALAELALIEGTEVWASAKATDIAAYPA